MRAAKQFFKEALEMSGDAPDRVTTDKEVSSPRAIRGDLGGDVLHRTNQYLNNLIEQDHRGIKQRYGPMKGFKSFESASRFLKSPFWRREQSDQKFDTKKGAEDY